MVYERLKWIFTFTVYTALSPYAFAGQDAQTTANLQSLQNEINAHGSEYSNLRDLTSNIGARISGSEQASRAVDWAVAKMQEYGFDRVARQPVSVPHWVRGNNERATIISSNSPINLQVAALGMSPGTNGLEAEVVEVQSLDQVRSLGSALRGKIVFYNRAMDASLSDAFTAYGEAVDQRSSGPNLASTFGAVAALVRSMTTLSDDDHPHTGMTRFRNGVNPIPAAALSTHAANMLSAALRQDPHTRVHLELSAERLADVTSFNVIGEITGRERPAEIALVGAHLDSWDLAQGAHDDGTGVVQTLEVCRAIKALGLIPKRTVRCVLFMTEEYGGIGAVEYAAAAARNRETHIAAVESDRGGFAPDRFDVAGNAVQLSQLQNWLPYCNLRG